VVTANGKTTFEQGSVEVFSMMALVLVLDRERIRGQPESPRRLAGSDSLRASAFGLQC